MSNENKNKSVEMNGVEVKNALAARIVTILKMDDGSKVEKFFTKEVKRLEGEIDTIKMNKQTAELSLKNDFYKLDSKIEDATVALEEAYEAVTIDNVKSNEIMAKFSESYWYNIDTQEAALERLNKERVSIQERYDAELKARNEKIAVRKSRIAKIS